MGLASIWGRDSEAFASHLPSRHDCRGNTKFLIFSAASDTSTMCLYYFSILCRQLYKPELFELLFFED
jgi:hypothetical protein